MVEELRFFLIFFLNRVNYITMLVYIFDNNMKKKNIDGFESFLSDVLGYNRNQMISGFFNNFFGGNNTAIAIIDPDMSISYANEECEKLTGYSNEELLNITWDKIVHPDDIGFMQKYHKARRENPKAKTPQKYEFRLNRKSGEIVDILIQVTFLEDVGKSIIYLIDISDLKFIEKSIKIKDELINIVIDNLLDVIILSDENGVIKYCSPSTANILGYYPEDLLNKNFDDFIHSDFHNPVKSEIEHSVISKSESLLIEYRYRHKTGKFIWLESLIHFVYSDNNSLKSIIFGSRDISNRKDIEAELEKSKTLVENILSNISDAFFSLDSNLVVTYFNRAAETLLNKKMHDVIGRKLFDVFPQARGSIFEKEYKEATETRRFKEFEVYFDVQPYKNWYFVRVYPIVNGVAVYFQVNTERKLQEIARLESEKKFRSIFENAKSMIGFFDDNARCIEVNPSMIKFTGYSREELLNMSIYEIIYAYSKPDFDKMWDEFIIKGEIESEIRLRNKDSSIIDVIVRFNANILPGIHLVILIDITERKRDVFLLKENEEKFRTLYENMVRGVIYLDKFGYIISSNTSAENILGFNSDEMIGTSFKHNMWQFSDTAGNPINYTDLPQIKALISKEAIENYEIRVFNPKKKGWVCISINSILRFKDSDVSPYQVIMIFEDITEKKYNEAAMEKYLKELRTLNANKDKFFSIVAHDLKSPFQSILGFSDVLLDEFDNLPKEEIKKYIGYIKSSVKKVYNFIDNLLQWSRLQTGRIEFKPAKMNLYLCVVDITNLLRTNYVKKSLDVINNIPKNIEIFADESMISSVVQNLLTNAIKFSIRGGNIEINCSKIEGYVAFSVKDTGIGMSEAEVSGLFSVGKNYTKDGTEREEGTGLGLLICKEMIDRHKGKIIVESEENKGSKFTVLIPEVSY